MTLPDDPCSIGSMCHETPAPALHTLLGFPASSDLELLPLLLLSLGIVMFVAMCIAFLIVTIKEMR